MGDLRNIASISQPRWLKTILADTGPPPRLFAWSPANLDPAASTKCGQVAAGSGSCREEFIIADDGLNSFKTSLDEDIYIVGAGNIGRLYASYLARHPNPVPITLVVHRKELLSQWVTSDGLELVDRSSGKTIKNKGFKIEWWTEIRPPYGPVREVGNGAKLRNVFIATKAAAGYSEADRLRRYLGRSSSVVFAQNGVSKLWPPHGHLYVAARYPAGGDTPKFSACIVNHGVLSTGPFQSVHAVRAHAFIGPVLWASCPLSPPCALRQTKQIVSPCDDFFIKYIITTPYLATKLVSSGELWLLQLEKLVMNLAINPLTTLLRCKIGHMFASRDQQQDPVMRVLDELLRQTTAVLQGLINHDSSTDILASYVQQLQPFSDGSHNFQEILARTREELVKRFSQPSLKSRLYTFGLKLAEHRSSMLQDAEAGKKTEIREVNGWIVEMADFLGTGIDVGIHRNLIKLIERGEILNREELARRLL
ncbi:hypothetical protein FQN54_004316 [Arachnomyces sp. PD_36]|nr:hypothetical protein FQN54_004316 [Arachnomyces sp. PD_36]